MPIPEHKIAEAATHNKDGDINGKVAVVAAYVFMILSNVLSFAGLYGSDNAVVSDAFPTYVTPDGITFSVWGIIYALHLVLTVAQCMPSSDAELLLSRPCFPTGGPGVRWRIALAFVLNGLWLPAFSSLLFGLSLVIIVAYLAALVSAYTAVNAESTQNVCQYLLYAAPIAANASWLVVATAANAFILMGQHGWKDDSGVSGTIAAALFVVIVVAALGSWMAVGMLDLAWSLVAAWALRGIYRAQTIPSDGFPAEAMNPTLAEAANVATIVVLIASEIGLLLALCLAYQSGGLPQPTSSRSMQVPPPPSRQAGRHAVLPQA